MFNYHKFLLDNFQTPRGLLTFLNAYGAETPGLATVEKWFQRQAVPANWFAVLLAYIEIDNGQPLSVIPYLGRTGSK